MPRIAEPNGLAVKVDGLLKVALILGGQGQAKQRVVVARLLRLLHPAAVGLRAGQLREVQDLPSGKLPGAASVL